MEGGAPAARGLLTHGLIFGAATSSSASSANQTVLLGLGFKSYAWREHEDAVIFLQADMWLCARASAFPTHAPRPVSPPADPQAPGGPRRMC